MDTIKLVEERLRWVRKYILRKTLKQVSEESGVPERSLHRIEKGETDKIHVAYLTYLQAQGVTLNEIFTEV